jgi:hypothetical protein
MESWASKNPKAKRSTPRHYPARSAQRREGLMKASIEVKDRREADAIRSGLEDPAVRAFVLIMGVMRELPTQRARARVLQYVTDRFQEEEGEPSP